MKHRAHGPADRRESSPPSGELNSADVADSLVANGVDSRVGAERSSSEDLLPNPNELIDSSPSAFSNTDREVAILKVQVGEMADLLRAFIAQQSLATPPSRSAASSSPEELSAQRHESSDSLSPFEMVESSSANPLGSTKPGAVSPLPVSAPASDKTGVEAATRQSDRDLPERQSMLLEAPSNSNASGAPGNDCGTQPHQLGPEIIDRTSGNDGVSSSEPKGLPRKVFSPRSDTGPGGSLESNDSVHKDSARSDQREELQAEELLAGVANPPMTDTSQHTTSQLTTPPQHRPQITQSVMTTNRASWP